MARVGKKRSDRRWRSDDGTIYASEFEYKVYEGLRRSLGEARVSRCETGKGDSFTYTTKVKQGRCLACGSADIAQERIYTPDVRIIADETTSSSGDYYIEAKGFFPKQKRNLLRSFVQARPDVNLIIILQRNTKPKDMKKTYGEYIDSYMRIPWFVWNKAGQEQIFDFLNR